MLIMLSLLHDLLSVVSHIFGPDSQVAVDHGIYHGLLTHGDLLPGGRNVVCSRLVRDSPGRCSRYVFSPGLDNYTLFVLPLARGTTLGSLVPVFLVPMPIR